ncbi:hypothetical protein [Evansella clarkii]|uniref:hypothetical protein n=1 Tax=Evansella clarkii TaxID=79879 RepID=UPI000996124A|nr:hypothetical protein [Evansella clarkii]
MYLLYFIFGTIFALIAVYHIFSHRKRIRANDEILYTLKDPGKLSSRSVYYALTIPFSYIILFLVIFMYLAIFTSFYTATLLFFIIFSFGIYVLLTIDRTFELRTNSLLFAGYHAPWSRIRCLTWGKRGKKRTKLIMELDKGTKIKTSIANEETEDLEKILVDYTKIK